MANNKLKERYNNLIKTEMYKEFKEENPDYELSYFFFVYEKDNFAEEQIGFYSEKADKVVSFDLKKHKLSKPEDAMKKSGTIDSFNISDVSVGIDKALEMSKKIQKEEYSEHIPTKYICILQVLNKTLTWNMTIVTSTLHLINVKIDASKEEIIKHSSKPIMSLAKK